MKKIILCALAVLLLSGAANADNIDERPISIGFIPYLSARTILKKYQPLADYLRRETGRDFVISVAKDYDTHLQNTINGKTDISFLGGSPYVYVAERTKDIELLARYEFNGRPAFRSVIYTSDRSDIVSLGDLKGKKVAFGSMKSTLSTIVPCYMLKKAGVADQVASLDYLKNHENAILGVLSGDYDAGAGAEEVFEENKDKGLRAIGYSPEVSTHVFVASAALDKRMIKMIKEALFTLSLRYEGDEVMESISPSLTGFVKVKDSDYDLLREILAATPELR